MRRVPQWGYIPLLIACLTTAGASIWIARWSVGWATFVMGVGVLAVGSLPFIWEHQYRKHAHQADGIVIAYKKGYPDLSESTAWLPIVRYTLPNGQEITFQNGDSHRPKSLPVSTKVAVLYDPEKPERAIIIPPRANVGAYLVVLFAVTLMGIGMLILVRGGHVS
jgi:hypothetical protein